MSPSNPQAAFMLIMPTANDAQVFAVAEHARVAIQAIQHLRTERMARVYAYAILPDHLRILLQPEAGEALREILRSLRGGVGRELGRRGFHGPVWMPKSEIRKIWNQDQIRTVAKEVELAPATVGIASNPESFPYCSAHAEAEVDSIDVADNVRTERIVAESKAFA